MRLKLQTKEHKQLGPSGPQSSKGLSLPAQPWVVRAQLPRAVEMVNYDEIQRSRERLAFSIFPSNNIMRVGSARSDFQTQATFFFFFFLSLGSETEDDAVVKPQVKDAAASCSRCS